MSSDFPCSPKERYNSVLSICFYIPLYIVDCFFRCWTSKQKVWWNRGNEKTLSLGKRFKWWLEIHVKNTFTLGLEYHNGSKDFITQTRHQHDFWVERWKQAAKCYWDLRYSLKSQEFASVSKKKDSLHQEPKPLHWQKKSSFHPWSPYSLLQWLAKTSYIVGSRRATCNQRLPAIVHWLFITLNVNWVTIWDRS